MTEEAQPGADSTVQKEGGDGVEFPKKEELGGDLFAGFEVKKKEEEKVEFGANMFSDSGAAAKEEEKAGEAAEKPAALASTSLQSSRSRRSRRLNLAQTCSVTAERRRTRKEMLPKARK